MIDKSIMRTFLLQYLEESSPYKVKMQVLECITNLLDFDNN